MFYFQRLFNNCNDDYDFEKATSLRERRLKNSFRCPKLGLLAAFRASDVLSEHSLTLTDLAANATPRSDVTVFRPRLEHLSRPGRVVLSRVTHPGLFVPSSLLFPESVAGGGGGV